MKKLNINNSWEERELTFVHGFVSGNIDFVENVS